MMLDIAMIGGWHGGVGKQAGNLGSRQAAVMTLQGGHSGWQHMMPSDKRQKAVPQSTDMGRDTPCHMQQAESPK